METYGERAKEILNELHTERLDYGSEYLPLIDCALQCAAYEKTGLTPEDLAVVQKNLLEISLNRLHDILAAERAGRLVVLPCKVGDTVYLDDGRGKDTAEVDYFQVYKDKVILSWVQYERSPECTKLWDFDEVDCNEIGKTIFLASEEVEKDD